MAMDILDDFDIRTEQYKNWKSTARKDSTILHLEIEFYQEQHNLGFILWDHVKWSVLDVGEEEIRGASMCC